MTPKIVLFLAIAAAVLSSDLASARDLDVHSRGNHLRSAPSMKVPRSRPAPRIVRPVYPSVISPGPDRSTIGLEYNRYLRERPTSIAPYMPIQ